MDSTARELGLGENIAIKLNRGSRVSGRQERYTTDTDKQLELEMPSILNETDKLLSRINIPTIMDRFKQSAQLGNGFGFNDFFNGLMDLVIKL